MHISIPLVKRQLRDTFCNVRFVAVIALSIAILVVQYKTAFRSVWVLPELHTFLNYALLFNQYGLGSQLYLILLPFLAALAAGSIYSTEKLSRRELPMYTRISRKEVMGSSLLSAFLGGGVAGSLPLWISLGVGLIREPHMHFINARTVVNSDGLVLSGTDSVLIGERSWVYGLYERNQVLLLVLTLAYVFILSGLMADVAVSVSYFTKVKYIEVLMPFLLEFLTWMATESLQWYGFSIPSFLDIRATAGAYSVLGAAVTLPILVLMVLLMYRMERRRDVL